MLEDRPSCIAVKKIWWQDGDEARLDVTLVTQLSVNRLQALEAQCKTWAGPLAAAVYLPLHNPGSSGTSELSGSNRQKLQAAVSAVDELVKSVAAAASSKAGTTTQRSGGCQLRVMLLYEIFAEERATALYPVNTLRNYARLLADTQLIANIDVDMLPSATLSRALLSPEGPGSTAALLDEIKRRNTAYVIPAFETTCGGPALADQVSQVTSASA
jgi:glycosyltransferase-like protein LARGE